LLRKDQVLELQAFHNTRGTTNRRLPEVKPWLAKHAKPHLRYKTSLPLFWFVGLILGLPERQNYLPGLALLAKRFETASDAKKAMKCQTHVGHQ